MKIIVAEDDPVVREIMLLWLGKDGHNVRTFQSADLAWLMIEAHPQDCDLLITDFEMPGQLNGLELCRKVKLLRPEIPVIVMSGNVVDDVEAMANSAGAHQFFEKPFDWQNFRAVIHGLTANPATV